MSDSHQAREKRCLDCGQVKPLGEFPPAKRRIDGRNSYCRPCMNVRSQASLYKRREENGRPVAPKRIVPEGMRWCPDCQTMQVLENFPSNRSGRGGRGGYCKPCHNARGQANVIKNHGSTRNYHLKGRYGISVDDFDRLLSAQGGLCAACRKAPAKHTDHDHKTGAIRGLLCSNCNQALGNARDDIDVLRRLVNYLHQSRGVRHRIRFETYEPLGFRLEYVPAVKHGR